MTPVSLKRLLFLLLVLLACPGCAEEVIPKIAAPVTASGSSPEKKGPGGRHHSVPVMGHWQVRDVAVEDLSGLCMNKDTTGLWAVGDEGALCAVSFDGDVRPVLSLSLDLEGVTIDAVTGDLYVAAEGDQMVCRIAAPDYQRVDTLFHVQEALLRDFENNGLEGIAYYRDSLLLVGSQEDALLWVYRLDGTPVTRISLLTETSLIDEIAGLFYDARKNWLWVTDSNTQRLFIFSMDGFDLVASYDVPFIENAESICVDRARSCVWVGSDEDTPKLYKICFSF